MRDLQTTVFNHQFSENAWLGGTHYFRNLDAVTREYHSAARLHGLNLNSLPRHYDSFSSRICLAWYNNVIGKVPESILVAGRINHLRKLAEGNRFCLYSTDYRQLESVKGVNGIFWIPDFQMYHLPEFFTDEDVQYRKENYRKGGHIASTVVVSSETARNDLRKFHPELLKKSRVLRFVTDIDKEAMKRPPDYVCEKYKMPRRFFYVPNQYWKHKNHLLVVHALEKAVKTHPEMCVVFSGSQSDARNPEWTSLLRKEITRAGISGNIVETGVIPKEDVYALMRQCCAVINVSRFEGWSTSVEESKAIGKEIILSAIDVHKEQAPPLGRYVELNDSDQLAKSLIDSWETLPGGPDPAKEGLAHEQLTIRLKEFAARFDEIVSESFEMSDKSS